LITGGDSGMGRAAAIAYAREGADVAINYFHTEEPDAQDVIVLIKAEGCKAVALPGDLREEAFCQKLVADAVSALGAWIFWSITRPGNNRIRQCSIFPLSSSDWMMKTNIYAPFWIIKAALPHLQPGSVIIGTAFSTGLRPVA
jgi:NAD(P)-dependent dehydrogenase (short-subunit alcohol dehydrogenase family)